jgi:hypothetical protein
MCCYQHRRQSSCRCSPPLPWRVFLHNSLRIPTFTLIFSPLLPPTTLPQVPFLPVQHHLSFVSRAAGLPSPSLLSCSPSRSVRANVPWRRSSIARRFHQKEDPPPPINRLLGKEDRHLQLHTAQDIITAPPASSLSRFAVASIRIATFLFHLQL